MKPRFYETLYLLHPELNDETRQEISQKLQDIITQSGGEIIKIDPWPIQKLAYRIAKQTHGYYVLMQYGAPGNAIQELTRSLKIDERVLKFMTLKKDDEFNPEALKTPEADTEGEQTEEETDEASGGEE